MSARSPNTFIIGAGPVATAIAGALRLAGVPVLGLWARRPDAARQPAPAAAGVAAFSSAPPDIMMESDVIIIAVRDAAIAEVAAMLVGTGLVNRRHVLVHCAGALAAEVAFAGVIGKVAGVAVMHPLRAITDGKRSIHELKGSVFGVQGDAEGCVRASRLVAAMGGNELPLARSQMAAYHAAAAIASNLVVALLDTGVATLMASGMSEQDATAALLPLAMGALQNVGRRWCAASPVRCSAAMPETVALISASMQNIAGVGPIYKLLSQRALAIAARGGLPDAAQRAVAAALE